MLFPKRLLVLAVALAGCASPYRRAMEAGDAALHDGRYEAARRSYEAAERAAAPAPEAAAERAQARGALAAVALLRSRPAEAEREFRRALESLPVKHPSRAPLLARLASSVALQGRAAEAVPLYEKAVNELAPNAPPLAAAEIWAEVGQLELAQRRYASAQQAYEKAIVLREKALGSEDASLKPLREDLEAARRAGAAGKDKP